MNPIIDLNADLGEGGECDAELIALASSVNIACGGHAGDENMMAHAIETALAAGAAIGAHPGYEDRESFGRKLLQLPLAEIGALMERQLERILGVAQRRGATLHHVKPHGALYLQACRDERLADAVAAAVARWMPGSLLYAPPGSAFETAASRHGLTMASEGFADRRYQDDGSLVPRSHPLAVIDDPEEAVRQALGMLGKREVMTLSGKSIPLPVRTLCVHGDSPAAVALLASVRAAVKASGIRICPP